MSEKLNRMQVRIPAISANESVARMAVSGFAMQLDEITLGTLDELRTAVSEAITNCVIHGYAGAAESDKFNNIVEICCELYEDRVVVSIEDFGVGIEDIAKAREPLFSGSGDPERSGMGFTVMEGLTDDIAVISEKGKGTKVILTKLVHNQ